MPLEKFTKFLQALLVKLKTEQNDCQKVFVQTNPELGGCKTLIEKMLNFEIVNNDNAFKRLLNRIEKEIDSMGEEFEPSNEEMKETQKSMQCYITESMPSYNTIKKMIGESKSTQFTEEFCNQLHAVGTELKKAEHPPVDHKKLEKLENEQDNLVNTCGFTKEEISMLGKIKIDEKTEDFSSIYYSCKSSINESALNSFCVQLGAIKKKIKSVENPLPDYEGIEKYNLKKEELLKKIEGNWLNDEEIAKLREIKIDEKKEEFIDLFEKYPSVINKFYFIYNGKQKNPNKLEEYIATKSSNSNPETRELIRKSMAGIYYEAYTTCGEAMNQRNVQYEMAEAIIELLEERKEKLIQKSTHNTGCFSTGISSDLTFYEQETLASEISNEKNILDAIKKKISENPLLNNNVLNNHSSCMRELGETQIKRKSMINTSTTQDNSKQQESTINFHNSTPNEPTKPLIKPQENTNNIIPRPKSELLTGELTDELKLVFEKRNSNVKFQHVNPESKIEPFKPKIPTTTFQQPKPKN